VATRIQSKHQTFKHYGEEPTRALRVCLYLFCQKIQEKKYKLRGEGRGEKKPKKKGHKKTKEKV
jgi:hypothetical protein